MILETLKANLLAEARTAAQPAIDAALKGVIERAVSAGFEAGREAMRLDIMAAASAANTASVMDETLTETAFALLPPRSVQVPPRAKAKRTPKGVTEKVVARVLSLTQPLPMEEIQRRAVEIDPRIAPKTIYNDLRRKKEIYQQDDRGNWSLRRDRPLKLVEATV